MPEPTPHGPKIDVHESLYRGIHPAWWVLDPQDQGDGLTRRLSSAAFNYPVFSVDIASLTSLDDSLTRRRASNRHEGMAEFSCHDAVILGFDVRKEKDELHPANEAHANVYSSHINPNQRKKKARNLSKQCTIRVEPIMEG